MVRENGYPVLQRASRLNRLPKAKKCRAPGCSNKFIPVTPFKKACCFECEVALGLIAAEKSKASREKKDREETRKKIQALKTRRDWIKDVQEVFNAFIRERDKDKPCICCGKFPDSDDWKPGGVWDAGHFLSRGAYPELRFEELNCHKQLKTCNGGSSKYAKKGRTVSQGYREGLIERIGLDRVEWLEGHHEPKHYTIEELVQLKAYYVKKRKELIRLDAA